MRRTATAAALVFVSCGSGPVAPPSDAGARDLWSAADLPAALDLAGPPDLTLKRRTLSFAPPAEFNAGGDAHSLVAADLDNDKKLDLVIGLYEGFGGVSVLLGNGDGTLRPVKVYTLNAPARAPA